MFRQRIPEYTGVRCILKEARVLQCCHYTRFFYLSANENARDINCLERKFNSGSIWLSVMSSRHVWHFLLYFYCCVWQISIVILFTFTYFPQKRRKLPCQKRSLPSFSNKTARKVFLSEPQHLSLPFSIDVISIDAILTQCQAN